MKKILKVFGIIAIIVVIGFSTVACGGDSGGGEETPPISAFAGTWNASNGRSIFISDNWFSYRVITDKPYEGNFSVSGSNITFTPDGSNAKNGKYTLSGDTLTLSNHTWDTAVNGTYTKVGDGGNTVVKTMTFTEFDGYWNEPGHETAHRWGFTYKDASNPFDLSAMYANNKAYFFTYSLTSDIDIDDFGSVFQNDDGDDWTMISNWSTVVWDCKKNTRYSSSSFFVPNADAAGTQSAKNFLEFYNKNRDVNNPATVSFYQFSLEQVEIADLNINVTADGSASSTTTQLTLTLAKAISGLSADNITLSGVAGVTKGTLSGSGTTYTLPISGFSKGGTLNVGMEKSGYVFKNWLKTATIYYKGSGGGGSDVDGTFDNLDGLKDWLNGKGNNTKNNPYKFKLKFSSLSGLKDFLKGSSGKFVKLDFSDSNLSGGIGADAFKDLSNLIGVTLPNGITGGIGANAFDGCTNLTDITLPSGINSIGANAFKDCSNLTSVTFNGTIPSGSFDTNAFSGLGDLRDKYLAGGTGTYTRSNGGTTWTKQGGSGGQNDPGDLAGTWTGKIGNYNATITISGSGWTMTASGTNFYDSGYFVRNGNNATLYLSSGTNNGTATLTNSTTIQVVLNNNTIFPGTYTLTKQGSSGGGGTDIASFAGTWNASGNRSIVFSGSSFTYKVNGTTKYSGTFSVSGSTITFNATGLGTASGGFSLSGTTLTLSNHTWDSSVNGTYTKDGGSGGGGGGNTTADVYVVGTDYDNTTYHTIASFWKNGTQQILSYTSSSANSVYVSGNDVYVAGRVRNDSNSGDIATLWKNGTAQTLSTSASSASASSVFVSGSNVYVAGQGFTSGSGSRATLWKNGTAQTLSTSASYANSVYVSGSDVYVAGYAYTGSTTSENARATLWKNGTAQILYSSTSVANSVYVSGSDVYVVGNVGAGGTDSKAMLWKNGTAQTLSNEYSSAISVYVSGTDVYVVGGTKLDGYDNLQKPTLWKNGTAQTLYNSSDDAYSVFVSGNDVYVSGDRRGAMYWKNGVAQEVLSSINTSSTNQKKALSIFVVSK